jgi:CheY-like chemotaxis protein
MPDYTILLIDYDPRSITRTSGLLVEAGYRVEVAKNGIEGLAAFKRLSPGLVLVEAMLPKKHGFEVCQEIKQSAEGANVPVVIFTAVYRGRKYRSQAFHLYKCDEYLEKPVPDDKLLEAIGRLLPIEARPEAAQAAQPATASAVAATREPSDPPSTPAAEATTPAETETAAAIAAAQPERAEVEDPGPSPAPTPTEPEAAPAPAAPRPRRPRRDEPIAQFTEDDIRSTLDAIMPDESAPNKTAAN